MLINAYASHHNAALQEDQALLTRIQEMMHIFCCSFKAYHGQLRQFILDDKGLVCIATWGLRKAVGEDSQANAVSCAQVHHTASLLHSFTAGFGPLLSFKF